MNDDELLASILRKFILNPDDGTYGGYAWVGKYDNDGPSFMTLDQTVVLTVDEVDAVDRLLA